MSKFTPEFIQEQFAICARATHGPWEVDAIAGSDLYEDPDLPILNLPDGYEITCPEKCGVGNNAQFISEARKHYRDALFEISKLRGRIIDLEAQLDGKWKCAGCGEWFEANDITCCNDEDICLKCFKEMEE